MRLFGHPVHLMLVHFPVALWPAHWGFHLAASWLPTGLAGRAGFWLLGAGTLLGWVAALTGAGELLNHFPATDPRRQARVLVHGGVNGSVLLGFTVLLGLEWPAYPEIVHGPGFLVSEALLLAVMVLGNYLGGSIDWRRS